MSPSQKEKKSFVAINNIKVREDYKERMEYLFQTRAKKIEECEGFKNMRVLRPHDGSDCYLVISEWDSEETFVKWSKSEHFLKGHERAFEDMEKAEKEGQVTPMESNFKKYDLVAS